MKILSGQSASVWAATSSVPDYPALAGDQAADVCVVGAGIAGLSTAYLLAAEGRAVVVLDDGPVGGGQTRQTTAHLACAIDDRFVEIERVRGTEGARLAAESHAAAIDRIEAVAEREHIACDLERLDGYLFVPPGEPTDVLDRERDAAHRAGLTAVERLDRAPGAPFNTGPCLRFPRQGQFHPLKYLTGLARALERRGGRIFTGAHARRVVGGREARVEAEGGTVRCGSVVVATNVPVNDLVAIHTKQAPYLTYVVGIPVPRGSVPKALWWDTADPYHYVRLQSFAAAGAAGGDGPVPLDLLIVGGEDHKSGQAHDAGARFARLEDWARERFPVAGGPAFQWSGQVMETIDGLAFIGPNPLDEPNVYIATGDSGMGMTHGTIAGMLLTDLILGRPNPWAALYAPSRKPLRAAGEYLRENLNVAGRYAEWLTGGEVSSPDEIPPGGGAVIRRGLGKAAVYRDEQGEVHACSATCPHLGCVVHWNPSDRTWDCPCHGSRFDAQGHVLNGPANRDLDRLEKL
jgi:glycine/D-amino acid oxidase-like deaminating enzyme/nitrite reductase/ring-hydroxylating ferredoxin subunit